ncbi:MAG TPA: hypothetical protein VHF89_17990 [Solirubrobacteraceae bacterium]|nr:hypothetical protein [Solirubrobacteraceae bacterium]
MRGRRSLLIAALALAGCNVSESEAPSPECGSSPGAVAAALRAAPGEVRLPDGTALSECVQRSESEIELQNLGVVLTDVAEDLEARAPDDPRAALQLGYLVGAARRGAPSESALQAELVIRLERSAAVELPPEGARALREGLRAGEKRG